MTIPDNVGSFPSTEECNLIDISTGSKTQVTCEYVGTNTIIYETICSSEACSSDEAIKLDFFFKNPPNTKNWGFDGTDGRFEIKTSGSDGGDIGFGELYDDTAFEANEFDSLSLETLDGCLNTETYCNFQISLRGTNPIPTTGELSIAFPIGGDNLDLTNAEDGCIAHADGDELTCVRTLGSITVTHSSEITTSETITIQVNNILTPSTTKPTDPFILHSTMTETDAELYDIDYDNSLIFDFAEPTQLTDVSVTRSIQTVSTPSQYSFTFTVAHSLSADNTIIIILPSDSQTKLITQGKLIQLAYFKTFF